MDPQIERPQYYEGEYLGAADLQASVLYARDAQSRHTLGAHLWGIAHGLELFERPLASGDVELVLSPGVAWDGYGRTLAGLVPRQLTLDHFANLQDPTGAAGVPVEIWIAFDELTARPPGPGFVCEDDTLFSRAVESFRFVVRAGSVVDTHLVDIASRQVEARAAGTAFNPAKGALYDESVPQQDFPDSGDRLQWPLFVGIARWRKDVGQPGRLLPRTDVDRNATRANRRYVGTVAETIVAPDGVIRIRDRSKDPADPITNFKPPIIPAPPAVNDLVWCEGHLRVMGDTRLQDGKLDYRVQGGGDGGVPMYLRRVAVTAPPAAVAKTTLDAFVGPAQAAAGGPQPETRFTVSTQVGNAAKECLTVVTDGRVGISAPDPTNTLQVVGPSGIRYEHAYITGDMGPSAATLGYNAYVRNNAAWVFPDAAKKAAGLFLDDAGAVPELRFATNQNTNPPTPWNTHLVVKGDTGNVGIGIGAAAPAAKLQLHSANPAQGDLLLFSATADFEYDGGNDHAFVFRDSGNGKTAFLGTEVGIGAGNPLARLHVAKSAHLNAIFDRTDTQDHLTVVVGSLGSGLRFSDANDFFIASQPYANRDDTGFGSEHLRVKANGNVGIGTTTPADRLYLKAPGSIRVTAEAENNGYAGFRCKNNQREYFAGINTNTNRWCVVDNIALAERLTVDILGRIGINDTSPAYRLDVNGDIHLTGDVWNDGGGYHNSDIRTKRNLGEIERPLERLLALHGVAFEWIEPEKHNNASGRYMGLIAQEAEQVFPEWVKTNAAGTKGIATIGFEGLAVEAIRELVARCERLEEQVAALRGEASGLGTAPPRPAKVRRKRVARTPARE